jgi:hypothetical protein
MWDPQHLTALYASTVFYGDSFIFHFFLTLYPFLFLELYPFSNVRVLGGRTCTAWAPSNQETRFCPSSIYPSLSLSLSLSAVRRVDMSYFNPVFDGSLFMVTFKRLYKETGWGRGERERNIFALNS